MSLRELAESLAQGAAKSTAKEALQHYMDLREERNRYHAALKRIGYDVGLDMEDSRAIAREALAPK